MAKDQKLTIGTEELQGVFSFNLCEARAKPSECPEDLESAAYFVDGAKRCFPLTSSKITKWTMGSLEGKKLPDGIAIHADNSNHRDKIALDLSFKLICDKNESGPINFTVTQEGLRVQVQIRTKKACGADVVGPLPDFLANPYIINPILIGVGLLLWPIGFRSYRPLIILLGFVGRYPRLSHQLHGLLGLPQPPMGLQSRYHRPH